MNDFRPKNNLKPPLKYKKKKQTTFIEKTKLLALRTGKIIVLLCPRGFQSYVVKTCIGFSIFMTGCVILYCIVTAWIKNRQKKKTPTYWKDSELL